LLSRPAAVGGAVLLLSFYLVMPPWPGVPDAGGTEHAFLINKNLIECVALLALAAMPTGTWFGLDGLFTWWFRRRREKTRVVAPPVKPKPSPAPQSVATSGT
ncbi:MAG: hypothetical protein ACREJB_10595, partial [Planctomycetaceae bacterium]